MPRAPPSTGSVSVWDGRIVAVDMTYVDDAVYELNTRSWTLGVACACPASTGLETGTAQLVGVGPRLFCRMPRGDIFVRAPPGRWTPTPRPQPRKGPGFAAMGDHVVLVGGYAASSEGCWRAGRYVSGEYLRSVERYSCAEPPWEELPPMRHARMGPAVTTFEVCVCVCARGRARACVHARD